MKRLSEMTLEELWQLFPIRLTEPNKLWPQWAAEEIAFLKSCLGGLISGIDHIGSTAIATIKAKPIIDLIVETNDPANFPHIKRLVGESGYICMNETATRIDFNKGYTPEGFAEKVFHLHLRLDGDNDEIAFRDYLKSHPAVAAEYEKLKLGLSKRFQHDRDSYTCGKSEFVARYTSLAKHLANGD